MSALLLILAMSAGPAGGQRLPTVFDLRDWNGIDYVTSVKSQIGGTCWTHGAMAAMEGNLMMTGAWEAAGEAGEPDLAEYHLDWWNGFNEHWNGDADPPAGGGLTVHMGGDYMVTAAYLARCDGAVRDVDGQSFDVPPPFYESGFHLYYPRHIEWFTAGPDLSGIDGIKQRLMEEGVIGTCMSYNGAWIEDFIHWQPPDSEEPPNHAIAIVGWNDTLQTQAPLPGAWLCKNSWGEGWGLGGFFWISYYDRWAGQEPQMGAVSFREVEACRYDGVYGHDYHGWRDAAEDLHSVMNAFGIVQDQMLESVSFYTTEDSTSWEITLYYHMQGGGLSGQAASLGGWFERRGFHTVDLPAPFPAQAGDSLYAALELDRGGYAYDRTSDIPVLLGAQYRVIVTSAASPGESFFRESASGAWQDFQGYGGNPYPGTGNFCIKLLMRDCGMIVSGPSAVTIAGDEGGPWVPGSWDVSIDNHGTAPLQFTACIHPAVPWLAMDGPAFGMLDPYTPLEMSFHVTEQAASLPAGAYGTSVRIVNETDGNGSTTIPVTLLVGQGEVVWSWDMDSDPGFDLEGDWGWGEPAGLGGEHGHPDPTSGHTGTCVLGYNLQGDYDNYMPEYSATLGPLDCTGLHDVKLGFMRWLNVQEGGFDEARVEASLDGREWEPLWQNPFGILTLDSAWVEVSLDLSALADDQPQVWLRWVMGPTNDGWRYSGWNIDDIEITALMDAGAGAPGPQILMNPVSPNPSRGEAFVSFVLAAPGWTAVSIYDASGRLLRAFEPGDLGEGLHSMVWDGTTASGRQAPCGVYHVMVRSGGLAASRSMVLLR